MKKNNQLRRFFISIAALFVMITLVSSLVLTYVITDRCEEYMLDETSALIAADATQLELNINSYLGGIEGNVALLFADDESMKYDSSTTKLDDYEKINIESRITSRIVDLGVLENYSDFCVVYANDNTVGWKSKTTENMYSDGGIYEDMCSYIKNDKTQDGWAFGVQDNYDRMYYVKRYNDNAVIIASFYTRELVHTFEYPEELQGMTVRLLDDNDLIVYSSDKSEIGQSAPEDLKDQLVTTNYCNNGWKVMCTIARDSVMKEFYKLRKFAYIFSAITIMLTLAIVVAVLIRLSKPMDGYVDALSEQATVDALSGVMNRRGYEELVTSMIEQKTYQESTFIMFDVDNFKKINDTLGHDHGDSVIARMGGLLSRMFVETEVIKPVVGRIGGDEFTVYIGLTESGHEADIRHILDNVLNEFLNEFAVERQSIPISLSAGAVMNYNADSDFQTMYNSADSALYISKQSGKNQYTMYTEGKANE